MEKELEKEIKKTAESLCRCMKYQLEIETKWDEMGIRVVFSGKDQDLLIQRNGDVLNALEYILNRIFSESIKDEYKIETDAKDFRKTRKEELTLLAIKASEKVLQYDSPVQFQPMPPHERRIIHMALKGNAKLKTSSAGEGEERKVIISRS